MKTKINDITSAIKLFENASDLHGLATEKGDFKTANNSYKDIVKSVAYLKEQNFIEGLLPLLRNPSVGVRIWAATYILLKCESEGLKILEEIARTNSIHSLTAKMTISEWEKGNLML